jgi:hypothetical protein
MGIRFLEVSRYYGHMDGLLRAQFAYPQVDFRHIISPSANLTASHLPLNYTLDEVNADVALGVKDGSAAALEQTREDVQDILHFFSLKKKLDPRVKGIKYEDFLFMKSAGEFDQNYSIKEDEHLKALFLQ